MSKYSMRLLPAGKVTERQRLKRLMIQGTLFFYTVLETQFGQNDQLGQSKMNILELNN